MQRYFGIVRKAMIGIGVFMFACGGQHTRPIAQESNIQGRMSEGNSAACPCACPACPEQNKLQPPLMQSGQGSSQQPITKPAKTEPLIEDNSTKPKEVMVSPPGEISTGFVPSVPPKANVQFPKVVVLDGQKHILSNLALENPSDEALWFLFPNHLPAVIPENNDSITDINIYAPTIENQPDRILVFGEFAGTHPFRAILLPAHSSVLLRNLTLPLENTNSNSVAFDILAIPTFFIRFPEQKTIQSVFSPYPVTSLKAGEKVEANVEIRGGHNMALVRAIPVENEERVLLFPSTPISIPLHVKIGK